jgi:hypothetical protein
MKLMPAPNMTIAPATTWRSDHRRGLLGRMWSNDLRRRAGDLGGLDEGLLLFVTI